MREVKTAGSDSMVVHSIAPVGSFCGDSSELCACVCVCVSFFKRVKKGIFYGDFKFVTKTEIKNEEGDVVAQIGEEDARSLDDT